MVCMTLKVPRRKLALMTISAPTDIGTPICHCTLQSSHSSAGRWQNAFSEVRVVFGKIKTTGTVNSNIFTVLVAEVDLRWLGNSPLVVLFLTPSWFLSLELQTAVIAFGLQSTPRTSAQFIPSLGVESRNHTWRQRECLRLKMPTEPFRIGIDTWLQRK
jgi:hypothetical protein